MLAKFDNMPYLNPHLLVSHTKMGHIQLSWQKKSCRKFMKNLSPTLF